ncbi:unnamed protein product [Agarophyton chilense]|eukprot:gb/GEZJ01000955.1/.p1 GENE.gb/GEZJ01000955.1/~~gb/GEZJ01000955.1/.p1  ORF type:complete len:830 (-),score=92.63 gb/GEZJ01000955.1/:3920-6409(-)
MSSVSEEDVHHLQKFLESREVVSVVDAVSIVARIVENAARPDTDSPSSVAAARKVLSDLHENPSSTAIPKLLDICSVHARSQVLDVFILTSQAWKALVAAFVSRDASFSTEIGLGVIECALRSAFTMLVRAVSVQHGIRGSDVPDIARCVKITKFYCLNAAKCSKVLLSLKSRSNSGFDPFVDVLSCAMQLVAVTSHVLLFDPVLDSSTLTSIQEQLCPLIGTTLGSIMIMVHQVPDDESSSKTIGLFCKCLDKVAATQNFLVTCFEDLAVHSFLLLAFLHFMRLEVSEVDFEANNCVPPVNLSDRRWSLFRNCLVPSLFLFCGKAYAELILLRERATGQTYLDTISASAAQCIVLACGLRPKEDDRLDMENFLLQQISDSNPATAYVAHESLQSLYSGSLNDHGRLKFIAKLFQYLRVAFAIDSPHLDNRWIPLLTDMLEKHFEHFGTEKRLSHLLQWASTKGEVGNKKSMDDPPDQLTLRILSSLSRHMVNKRRESKSSDGCGGKEDVREEERELVEKLLTLLAGDESGLVPHKLKDDICKVCSSESAPAWAIPLSPFLSDPKSVNERALKRISQEAPLSVVCSAFNILQPSSMTSKDMESICKFSGSLLERHGYSVGPAIAAFVARSSSKLHGSVSVADWQYLSDALEQTVLYVLSSVRKDPHWSVLSNMTLYHAAMTLSYIRGHSISDNDRKTVVTLSDRILPLAEEVLERLKVSRNASLTLGGRGLVNERMAAEREIRIVKGRTRNVQRYSDASDLDFAETMRVARLGILETLCDLLSKKSSEANHNLKSEIRSLNVLLGLASQLFPDAQNNSKDGLTSYSTEP